MMQSLEPCVLCKSKIEQSPSIENYYPGYSAHLQCIQEKFCVYCGISGMCVKCQHKDCPRAFHQHCYLRYFTLGNNEFALMCDLHRKTKGKKKEYQKLWLTRQVSNKVGLNIEVLKKVKENQGENKAFSICSGQVFWYMIGTQFFPNFISLEKPEIEVKSFVDYEEEPWGCDIEEYIERISKESEEINEKNLKILNECKPYNGFNVELMKEYKEEEIILAETRNL